MMTVDVFCDMCSGCVVDVLCDVCSGCVVMCVVDVVFGELVVPSFDQGQRRFASMATETSHHS